MNPILLVLALLAATFVTRFSMLAIAGRVELPAWSARALRLVLPAVMLALVAPAVFTRAGALNTDPLNPRLWAALLAAGVAWKTRSMTWTMVAGMGVLWAFAALAPAAAP
ncbi:MAG: AzlD domain-containing protein [Thermoflexales bacterium]|nr:AzlD domain-containing protein [Thermoflexales bacterium]